MINISQETYLMCKYYMAGLISCAVLGPYCAYLIHMYLNGNLDTFRTCIVGNLFIPMFAIILIIITILIVICRDWNMRVANSNSPEYHSFSSR
jgi:hypothetical protein